MSRSLLESLRHLWSGPEIQANSIVVVSFLTAMVLGALVGYERAYHGRAAGMRTYAVVCMASAALVSVTGYGPLWFGGTGTTATSVVPTQVIQGIVTGVGFLGAGVIMKEGFSISGLTTAASIWASSAIGILVGVGFYLAAILLALLSATCMAVVQRLERWLPAHVEVAVTVSFRKDSASSKEGLFSAMEERGFQVLLSSLSVTVEDGKIESQFVAASAGHRDTDCVRRLQHLLAERDDVESFRLAPIRH